ncbi:hypothetical protein BDF19DRAFT_156696 [Syncephalis fuscata]|nr:hypothetical protein BDF19DRAFT_156696 [Syncephalis fuscata]
MDDKVSDPRRKGYCHANRSPALFLPTNIQCYPIISTFGKNSTKTRACRRITIDGALCVFVTAYSFEQDSLRFTTSAIEVIVLLLPLLLTMQSLWPLRPRFTNAEEPDAISKSKLTSTLFRLPFTATCTCPVCSLIKNGRFVKVRYQYYYSSSIDSRHTKSPGQASFVNTKRETRMQRN